MTQSTVEELGEFLSTLFVGVIVIGFNPATVLVGGAWYVASTFPATVLARPIVKDMMFIGMIQYWELWMLFLYLWLGRLEHGRWVSPKDVGIVLLGTIPFYGLAFYALLHPMNMVLKVILIIFGTVGGLPITAIMLDP